MVKAPQSAPQSPFSETLTPEAVANAAWRAIAVHGWRRLALGHVAAEAGVPVARLLQVVPSRAELVRVMLREVDARMLADVDPADEQEPHRDRLFDLVLRRLELLAGHRNAVSVLLREGPRDPSVLCVLLAEGRRSQSLMLEAAGISSRGWRGEARVQGLGVVLASVTRTWMKDDTPDLAHTMKAVDKALDQAEKMEHLIHSCVPFRGRCKREEDGLAAASEGAGESPDRPAPPTSPPPSPSPGVPPMG